MTVFDRTPTVAEFFLHKLSRSLARKRETTISSSIVATLFRFAMHVAGFSCLTIAGFALNFAAGMITAGVSCFALSWLTAPSRTEERR